MSYIAIEEESGTFTSASHTTHRHNGYSAGRFTSSSAAPQLARWFEWGRIQSAELNRRPAFAGAGR